MHKNTIRPASHGKCTSVSLVDNPRLPGGLHHLAAGCEASKANRDSDTASAQHGVLSNREFHCLFTNGSPMMPNVCICLYVGWELIISQNLSMFFYSFPLPKMGRLQCPMLQD